MTDLSREIKEELSKYEGWAMNEWSATWKRVAKNYRQLFRLCACVSVPLWQRQYWTAKRQARAWKAAAKRWRRRALEAEATLADHDRDFIRAHLASYGLLRPGTGEDVRFEVGDG